MQYNLGDYLLGFEEYGGKIHFYYVIGISENCVDLCELGAKQVFQYGYEFYQIDPNHKIKNISIHSNENCILLQNNRIYLVEKIHDKNRLFEDFNTKFRSRIVDKLVEKSLDGLMI
jgi:hypothetical protein